MRNETNLDGDTTIISTDEVFLTLSGKTLSFLTKIQFPLDLLIGNNVYETFKLFKTGRQFKQTSLSQAAIADEQ